MHTYIRKNKQTYVLKSIKTYRQTYRHTYLAGVRGAQKLGLVAVTLLQVAILAAKSGKD